jgi:hypothetical protein
MQIYCFSVPCARQHLPLSVADDAVCSVILLLSVLTMSQGGWARTVDVYCQGARTCGVARTTTATNMITTSRWAASTTTVPNAWDVAVLRTAATLPGTALVTAQVRSPQQLQHLHS